MPKGRYCKKKNPAVAVFGWFPKNSKTESLAPSHKKSLCPFLSPSPSLTIAPSDDCKPPPKPPTHHTPPLVLLPPNTHHKVPGFSSVSAQESLPLVPHLLHPKPPLSVPANPVASPPKSPPYLPSQTPSSHFFFLIPASTSASLSSPRIIPHHPAQKDSRRI